MRYFLFIVIFLGKVYGSATLRPVGCVGQGRIRVVTSAVKSLESFKINEYDEYQYLDIDPVVVYKSIGEKIEIGIRPLLFGMVFDVCWNVIKQKGFVPSFMVEVGAGNGAFWWPIFDAVLGGELIGEAGGYMGVEFKRIELSFGLKTIYFNLTYSLEEKEYISSLTLLFLNFILPLKKSVKVGLEIGKFIQYSPFYCSNVLTSPYLGFGMITFFNMEDAGN